MKVSSIAPSRISLFGGGTDVNPFASTYGGLVINLAINLRQQVILNDKDLAQINIPDGANSEFYKIFLEELNVSDICLRASFDGLIRSGIGSSASCAVAIIGAINKLKGLNLTRDQIAEKAWDIEVNKLGLYGGKQDQYSAVYGGFNVMEIGKKVKVTPLLPILADKLFPSFVFFHTGQIRTSTTIQEGFKTLDSDQKDYLFGIKELAYEALTPIGNGDIEHVGLLLDKTWEFKKLSNKGVTTPEIDKIYTKGLVYGAWGGKILGSGGGGYMLFMVDPKKRDRFIEKMGIVAEDISPDYNGLEVRRIE